MGTIDRFRVIGFRVGHVVAAFASCPNNWRFESGERGNAPISRRSPNAFRHRTIALGLLFVSVVLSTACGDKISSRDSDTVNGLSGMPKVTRGMTPALDAEVAVIETADFGRIVIELYPNIAPGMVARFKQLIKDGFYNGTTFHRVNPDSGLIQGGDPLSMDDDPTNDGMGDSNYPNVTAEFNDIPYERGTVGAARRGPNGADLTEEKAWDTANCQFFITLKRTSAFDQSYTVFGKVIDGISNADVIAGAPVGVGTERPQVNIVIKSVTLQPRSNFVK